MKSCLGFILYLLSTVISLNVFIEYSYTIAGWNLHSCKGRSQFKTQDLTLLFFCSSSHSGSSYPLDLLPILETMVRNNYVEISVAG